MRIIISPAKKMKIDDDFITDITIPKFIKETEILLTHLKTKVDIGASGTVIFAWRGIIIQRYLPNFTTLNLYIW